MTTQKMNNLIRKLRLFILGPRSVDSVLKTFTKASADLAEATAYHNEVGVHYSDLAGKHFRAASRADRVADRINALTE